MICNQEPRHYKHSFDVWFHFFFPDVLFASLFLPNDASFPNSQALSLIFSQLFFFAFLNQNSFWVLTLLWPFSKRLKDLAKSFGVKLIAINFSLFVLYSVCWFPFLFVTDGHSLVSFKCHFPLLTELADSQNPLALQQLYNSGAYVHEENNKKRRLEICIFHYQYYWSKPFLPFPLLVSLCIVCIMINLVVFDRLRCWRVCQRCLQMEDDDHKCTFQTHPHSSPSHNRIMGRQREINIITSEMKITCGVREHEFGRS